MDVSVCTMLNPLSDKRQGVSEMKVLKFSLAVVYSDYA